MVGSRDSQRRFKGRHPDLWTEQRVGGLAIHQLEYIGADVVLVRIIPLLGKAANSLIPAIPQMQCTIPDDGVYYFIFLFYFTLYYYLSNSTHREASF